MNSRSSSAYSASCSAPSGSAASLAISALRAGSSIWAQLVLLVGWMLSAARTGWEKRFGEVVRVRIVLEPIGPAGIEVGGGPVAHDREVVVGADHFQLRVEAEFLEHVLVVGPGFFVGPFVVGPDGDLTIGRVGLGDHLLCLGEVVGVELEPLVPRHPFRQD